MSDTSIVETLFPVSGSSNVLLTGPGQNLDFIRWLIDWKIRATTPTTTLAAPYAFPFDTTSCANGYHVVQPVGYVAGYRGFNPASVSGCKLWVDFSDSSSYSLVSGAISSVSDKTGTCLPFTQSTSSMRPTLQTGVFNGLDCANFDVHSSQILLSTSTFGFGQGDVFIVAAFGLTSGQILLGAGTTANTNNWIEFGGQSGNLYYANDAAGTLTQCFGSGSLTAGAICLGNWRSTGSHYNLYQNGTQVFSDSSTCASGTNDGSHWWNGVGAPQNITIGGVVAGSNLCSTVQICEILVYNTTLSSTDRAHVEAYLAEKWLPSYSPVTGAGIPALGVDWTIGALSTPYTGGLVNYSAFAEVPYAIYVDNSDGITMPTLHNHYSHIKVGHLNYSGTINATDLSLFASSIDFGNVSSSTVVDSIRVASPDTTMVLYVCLTEQDWFNTLDWLNYADANGLDRELAFWHVNADTPHSLSNWGSGGMPNSWFWDCQRVVSGTMTAQYTANSYGQMGPATANLQNGSGGSWANGDGGHTVTLGPASGDYVMVGYHDKFDEINFVFSTTGAGGYTYTVEYPTATNLDGTPSAWAAFTSITDGTSNATANGKIHFDPHPATPWVKCYAKAGGSGLFIYGTNPAITAPNGVKGYYVRIKTTAAGSRTPICTTILACDFANQGNTWSFTTPKWNGGHLPGAGDDLDGDGYLNDTEYANAGSPNNGGHPVRWYYQSRMPSLYGTNNMYTNFTDDHVKTWAADWANRFLLAFPQYDGLFLDDSGASGFSGTIESGSNYAVDYGKCVSSVWRNADPGPLGQRIMVPNMGPDTVTDLNSVCPAAWRETQMTEVLGWSHYATHMDTVARVASQFSPPPFQFIDCFYTAGNSSTGPSDRIKLLMLSAYYCIATPQTYFVPFADNYGSLGPDYNIFPNRWVQALTVDIGQPTAPTYVIASGSDPSPSAGGRQYKVYARDFDNALVLYKPLSDNGSGSVNTDTSSASNTTVTLPGGSFYQLNADSSPGSSVSGTVQLANGQGMILIKS